MISNSSSSNRQPSILGRTEKKTPSSCRVQGRLIYIVFLGYVQEEVGIV